MDASSRKTRANGAGSTASNKPVPSTPPLTTASVEACFGALIMGQKHAKTLCPVQSPLYYSDGVCVCGDVVMVQLCRGANARATEALYARCVAEVQNHRNCRERTGAKSFGPEGKRYSAPFEMQRQRVMAEGASDIGQLMQQGFNFVKGSAWVMTAGSFMYSAYCQHYAFG